MKSNSYVTIGVNKLSEARQSYDKASSNMKNLTKYTIAILVWMWVLFALDQFVLPEDWYTRWWAIPALFTLIGVSIIVLVGLGQKQKD